MSEIAHPARMREKVCALQREMAKLPQIDLPTDHLFAKGMYARSMSCPSGSLIVGKVHKHEHFFILAKGRMQLTTDDGVKVVEAPAILVAQPGTKRAGLALDDCLCINVHRTDETDLDAIEAEQIEPDETALFDSSNRPKELT